MIEQNRQCLLAKTKDVCHIHKNMKPKSWSSDLSVGLATLPTVKVFKNEFLDALKIIDLENKISKLEKKMIKMTRFQDNQKVELTNLYKTIEKKNKVLKDKEEHILKLQNELESAKNTINTMKDDYNSYQYIIKYERNKQELINKGVNIYNYYNDEFHKNRQIRNVLAHRIK
jgi:chromosome segregation ATPase